MTFDADKYSKEEAEEAFVPYEGTTQNEYPYTGYEFEGEKLYDVTYLGEFEENKLPHNNDEFIEYLLKIKKINKA